MIKEKIEDMKKTTKNLVYACNLEKNYRDSRLVAVF